MGFHKSRVRTVVTLAEGTFEAREVQKRCASGSCGAVVGSRELARVVKPRQRFGYDLIVHVGLARYLGGRQREEICAGLREQYGIELSSGSVTALCDRFLLHLEALHLCRTPHLRAAMADGHALHVDATCDKGKGGLFVCMDGVRGWVLTAARIPSENADFLRPVVELAVSLFGEPMAVVRDLGDAGAKAVGFLRDQGIPDLVCHRHFLGAVGKKLFDRPYALLRNALRTSKVRTGLWALLGELRRCRGSEDQKGRFAPGPVREELPALVLWLLEGTGKKDPLYPFGLPHLGFVQRCREASRRAEDWVPNPRNQSEGRALRHLAGLVARLERDENVAAAVDRLEERWRVFSELRGVLSLSNAELPGGDFRRYQLEFPALEKVRLLRIEKAVELYTSELVRRLDGMTKRESEGCSDAIVLGYLAKYGDHLFGHPAIRDEDGNIRFIVERTNNPPEHFFGACKQLLRRRLGRASLGRDLQQQPAQAALVPNLRDPAYLRVLCGSLENLPAAFAALEEHTIEEGSLVRDHRDSQLQRLVAKLLETQGGEPAAPDRLARGSCADITPTAI